MTRNRYAPPTAKLAGESRPGVLTPVLVALIGGAICWFTALKMMRWVYVHFWLPRIESGNLLPGGLENVITVSVVYAVFAAALALLRAQPWWTPWLPFMVGTVIYIVIRNLLTSRGIASLVDIFLGQFFLAAAVSSFASFLLVSRYFKSRSNTSLKRTRGG